MEIFTYIFGGWLVIGLIFVAYGREKTWVKIFGTADLGAVDFASFSPTKKPNHALFCPKDYCPNAGKYKLSPTFELPVNVLKGKLLALVEAEPHMVQVAADDENLQYRYVQYTPLMRYPDTIRIQLIELGDGKSSFAIFSESQIGKSDLGVNFKRVNNWLKQL